MLTALLDRYFGTGKAAFTATRLVPANPNDAYYNEDCLICRSPYDDQHTAVRVLTCNHIFGSNCLQEMIKSPHGPVCPICRCVWYREAGVSGLLQVLGRGIYVELRDAYLGMERPVLELYHALPSSLKAGLRFLWNVTGFLENHRRPLWWARIMIPRWTDLDQRNPSLILAPQMIVQDLFTRRVSGQVFDPVRGISLPSAGQSMAVLSCSTLVIMITCSVGPVGGWDRRRDAWIFALILALGTMIADIPEFWVLWHFYHGQDLKWILEAANGLLGWA